MRITITAGVGEGPTPLAAFDAALLDAGVANYNLIYLSSVIPTGSEIELAKFVSQPDEYGYRLYVVAAWQHALEIGQTAWAGLGWTQDETGRGLFVELHGSERDAVEADIQATLTTMIQSRPLAYGPIQSKVIGVECRGRPACAIVLAVYKSESW